MAGMSAPTPTGGSSKAANAAFKKQLNKVYAWYTGGFVAFVLVLAVMAWQVFRLAGAYLDGIARAAGG